MSNLIFPFHIYPDKSVHMCVFFSISEITHFAFRLFFSSSVYDVYALFYIYTCMCVLSTLSSCIVCDKVLQRNNIIISHWQHTPTLPIFLYTEFWQSRIAEQFPQSFRRATNKKYILPDTKIHSRVLTPQTVVYFWYSSNDLRYAMSVNIVFYNTSIHMLYTSCVPIL